MGGLGIAIVLQLKLFFNFGFQLCTNQTARPCYCIIFSTEKLSTIFVSTFSKVLYDLCKTILWCFSSRNNWGYMFRLFCWKFIFFWGYRRIVFFGKKREYGKKITNFLGNFYMWCLSFLVLKNWILLQKFYFTIFGF